MGQACDQACSQAGAHRGVRGCPQGGLHQVKDQPQEGQEACCQEVVLYSFRGVWPCLNNHLNTPQHRQENSDTVKCDLKALKKRLSKPVSKKTSLLQLQQRRRSTTCYTPSFKF